MKNKAVLILGLVLIGTSGMIFINPVASFKIVTKVISFFIVTQAIIALISARKAKNFLVNGGIILVGGFVLFTNMTSVTLYNSLIIVLLLWSSFFTTSKRNIAFKNMSRIISTGSVMMIVVVGLMLVFPTVSVVVTSYIIGIVIFSLGSIIIVARKMIAGASKVNFSRSTYSRSKEDTTNESIDVDYKDIK